MAVKVDKWLVTVEAYHKMIEAEVLKEEDKVELLFGEIVHMSPIKSYHASHVRRISRMLNRLFGEEYIIDVQNPIQLGSTSEPEPDISLLALSEDLYLEKHPSAKDIHLLVEVAESSLEIDRSIKRDLYAEFGISLYWIINIPEKQIEVFAEPVEGVFSKTAILRKGDSISILGKHIPVSKLLA